MSAQAVVVGRGGELTTEIADGIIIEGDSQFQFNGHPSFAITEIPDAFTQNGIHHRPDCILCAPYGIEISHAIPKSSISKISVEPLFAMLFTYYCYYQLSGAAIVAELAEVDALPGAEVQAAIGNGDGDANTAQC